MAENSWPFASGSGTAVGEDQWSMMARLWADSGVVSGSGNQLEVYGDSSGRQVKVKTGRAVVRGHFYENTSEVTLAIGANASGNPRIDRVVLELDPTANTVALKVVAGTPAGSPAAPTLTQTDVAVFQMTLARVAVAAGATTIAAGNITDERVLISPSLPKTGGTLTGRAIINQTSGYSQVVLRNTQAAYWISTDPGASDALTVAVLNKDTLAYTETALAITKDGHVSSASHVGGVSTGTTDIAGFRTLTLPASPTGNWALTVTPVVGLSTSPIGVGVVGTVTSTSAQLAFWNTASGSVLASTSTTVHWQAIAY